MRSANQRQEIFSIVQACGVSGVDAVDSVPRPDPLLLVLINRRWVLASHVLSVAVVLDLEDAWQPVQMKLRGFTVRIMQCQCAYLLSRSVFCADVRFLSRIQFD